MTENGVSEDSDGREVTLYKHVDSLAKLEEVIIQHSLYSSSPQ